MNPFFSELMRGISDRARTEGFDLLLSSADPKREKESLERWIHGGRIDGLILLSSKKADPYLTLLEQVDFPVSMVGRTENSACRVSWVNNDNASAAFEAVRYLIELGHQRIAFLGGNPELLVTEDRMDGYQKALAAHGLHRDPRLIVSGSHLEQGGYHGMMRLLALADRPTAVLASDDVLAFGAIQAAAELGYQIPENLSVIGFNNIRLAEAANPNLTTVHVFSYELGWHAADLLFQSIRTRSDQPKSFLVPTELRVRHSCGPLLIQQPRGTS